MNSMDVVQVDVLSTGPRCQGAKSREWQSSTKKKPESEDSDHRDICTWFDSCRAKDEQLGTTQTGLIRGSACNAIEKYGLTGNHYFGDTVSLLPLTINAKTLAGCFARFNAHFRRHLITVDHGHVSVP